MGYEDPSKDWVRVCGRAALSMLLSAASAGTAYNYTDCKYDVRVGARGDLVTRIQQSLIYLGYLDGKADGSYGQKTKAAVEAFQRNNGIHGDSRSYGVATEMTQAVLFSASADFSYTAPRLSSWSNVLSEPYTIYDDSIKFDVNLVSETLTTKLLFTIQNDNETMCLNAFVVRYWLEDSKGQHLKYNGYDCYQNVVTIYSADGLAPGERGNITLNLAPAPSPTLNKASAVRWTVTELVYSNGEVFMDYDATARDYGLRSFRTYLGW